jgi:hypothetical protein
VGTTQTHGMRFHRITFLKSVPVFATVFALAIVDPSHAATKKRSVKRVPPTTTVQKAIAKAPIPSTTVQPVAAPVTNTAISTTTPPASPAKAPKFREFYYIQVSNVRNTLFLDGTNTVSNSTIRISGCSQELPVACKAEFATNAKPIVANGPFGSLRLQTSNSGSLSQEIDSFERDFLCNRYYYKTKFKLSRIVSVNNLTFDSDGFVSGFNGAWERVDTLLDPKPQDCGAGNETRVALDYQAHSYEKLGCTGASAGYICQAQYRTLIDYAVGYEANIRPQPNCPKSMKFSWGDGTSETIVTNDTGMAPHTYTAPGRYEVVHQHTAPGNTACGPQDLTFTYKIEVPPVRLPD